MFISILWLASANAQLFPFYKYHKWEANPSHNEEVIETELYHYTKYLLSIEYIFDEQVGQYYKYESEHYKIKLSTDAAMEEFNKVYIPMENVLRIKKLQTRVIKKDRTVEINPNVEEFFSEDEDERYYYFPLSQLELGDEIEIFYTVQKEPEFDGDQFFFQTDIPIYDFDFYFIAPNDSYFQFLAHNDLKEPVLLDTILQRHVWHIGMDSIPPLEAEYFSEYNNTTMKLDASLRGFDSPDDKSYSPYFQFCELLNGVYNKKHSGKDLKALRQLNKRLGVNDEVDTETKVRLIERYVKQDLGVAGDIPDLSLAEIVKYEKSNSIGAIVLYMGLCQAAGIYYEYGFISDRYDTFFSDEIQSMYFLQNYFLYFPEIDEYLAPLDFSTRLGYMDANWIPNNAYFLSETKEPVPSTNWEIRWVDGTTAFENTDSIIIRIDVDERMEEGELTIERHIKGYKAGKYQTYYYLYSDAQKESQHDELLNFFQDNSKFKMTEIDNVNPEDAFVESLVIKGKMTELYQPFIEKAGDKTIFKLGNLFGQHVSINELRKKKTDFVFSNPMIRTYTVIVNFPSGVEVTNQEDLFQTEDYCDLDDINMSTSLDLKGNVLTFTSREEYLSYRYKIEDKEDVFKAFEYYDELTKMNLIIK